MMKNYRKPVIKQDSTYIEQVLAFDCVSGKCCPFNRDKFSYAFCPAFCTERTFTLDPMTGKVLASSCPKFNNGLTEA